MRPPLLALVLWSTASLGFGADIPRPEHPRPEAARSKWSNLNGTWEFRFDPKDEGLKAGWEKPNAAGFDRSIVVPFPWESELSGVHVLDGKKVGWYRRKIAIPADFPAGNRVWLHFGAVDWRADVWVDGNKVAEHEGGYSPFAADITDAVSPGKEAAVVVRAFDPTDPELPTGKQVGWYTPASGIWQTVWLESRPKSFISDFTIQTDLTSATIEVAFAASAKGTYTLSSKANDGSVTIPPTTVEVDDLTKPATAKLKATVRDPKLWTPDTPTLYEITLDLKSPDGTTDEVRTYFGLRTIARGKYGDEPFERILLNGKPIYLRTALDQSFNPKGIYTAPDDDFLKRDLNLAKFMGLNGLRIHIKPDEPRRLYWADRIGLLILEDMPNTWRQSPRARKAWESGMREAIARDKNHPSIIAWITFNETWGLADRYDDYKKDRDTQSWVKSMIGEIRKLDASRLVEDNSPCYYDHVEGSDINSWHFYIDNYNDAKAHIAEVIERTRPGSNFNFCPGEKQSTAPLINSEYGAVSAGSGDRDISWGFRDLTTQLRMQPKIQGYVYTELTDIEWEHNGFADYDRGLKQFGYEAFLPDMRPNELNGDDFVGFDAPPAIVGKPGEEVTIPVFISHYSSRDFEPKLRYWVDGYDENGDNLVVSVPKSIPARWTRYGVTHQEPLKIKLPKRPFVGALCLTLRDPKNQRFAANFVNLVVKEDAPKAVRSADADHEAHLRFSPNDYARSRWSGAVGGFPGKVSGQGKGFFEYRIKVPQAVVKAGVESIFLRMELAARAGRPAVDWPSRLNSQDYPQTDARTSPTTIEISINGRRAIRDELADDPADARGVLSHLAGADHGSHGYLVETLFKPNAKELAELAEGKPLVLKLAVPDDAEQAGGLSIYGANSGLYPFDPVLHILTKEALPKDLGVDPSAPVATDLASNRTKNLLPAGDSRGTAPTNWSYTTEAPPRDWISPSFDDAAWQRGEAGFGSAGTPAVQVRTPWKSPRIWMRTKVAIPKLQATDNLRLHLFHDEDVEVFVNGKPLFQGRGYLTTYQDVALSAEQKALFKVGENVISVNCRQTGGGQGIDLGLILQADD